jgi:Rod binding domain-containing protein
MNISALQSHVNAADIPLQNLAANPNLTEQQKIGEAGRQFEAALLRQILAEAQKPTFKSKYTDDSTTSSIYRDMTVTQLADSMSRAGGLGLAQTLNTQLSKQLTDK